MSGTDVTAAAVPHSGRSHSRRAAYEMLAVLAVTILPSLIWPPLKGPLSFLPIVYLLVERHLRGRTWREVGLDPRGFWPGLQATWPLVLLVAIGTQALTIFVARAWWPALLSHIMARVPLIGQIGLGAFLVPLLIATLAEELAYRGLFQERLSWLIGTVPAVALIAIGFGLMHVSPGDPGIVAADVAGVIVDGAIYGAIFARGRNLYVAWLAHFAADVIALALIALAL